MTDDQVPYYRYKPKQVLSGDNRVLYWDRYLITDHSALSNRPDIVLIDHQEKSGYVMYISFPTGDNIDKTMHEKTRKYQDLFQDPRQLYKLERAKVYPIIITSNGLIPDDTIRSIVNLQLQEKILEEGQKAVILSTASIVRKFLNIV